MTQSGGGGGPFDYLMNWIYGILYFFSKPLVVFLTSITSIVALILGAIRDPAGAANAFLCRMIDVILIAWPTTPESYKLGSLLSGFANSFPVIGYGVVLEIAQALAGMAGLFVLIKIYKLLPFKAS